MRYANVLDGQVVNVIIWDGESEYESLAGGATVPIPDDLPVGTGWGYEGGEWIAPPPVAEPAPESFLEG